MDTAICGARRGPPCRRIPACSRCSRCSSVRHRLSDWRSAVGGETVRSSQNGSKAATVQTIRWHRPYGESKPQHDCFGDLTDCFCALLEGEDLEEVFFE